MQRRPTSGPAGRDSSERDSELLISLIASGLVRISRWSGVSDKRRPYDASLQLGLDRLAAECARAGIKAPLGVGDLVWDWCANRPLRSWPLTLPAEADAGGDVLLIAGAPSEFCVEWAVSAYDVVSEIHESAIVAHVKNVADTLARPDLYAQWRWLLIDHAVFSATEFLVQKNRFLAVPQWATWLEESYEPIPPAQAPGGVIAVCGSCRQWMAPDSSGAWCCSTTRCRSLQNLAPATFVDAEKAVRLRSELVRFIALPGRPEIDLARDLAARGARVVLFPGLDALDLLATWPDGYSVGIDVKDWVKPYLLARRIKMFPDWQPGIHPFGYQRGCLVVPKDRVAANPRYCTIVKQNSSALKAQPQIEVLSDEALIASCPETGVAGEVVCGP